jgi:hypothetical protein
MNKTTRKQKSVDNFTLTPSISLCHMFKISFLQRLYPEDGDGASFLTMVITYQTIRYRNQEEHNVEDLYCSNLISRIHV